MKIYQHCVRKSQDILDMQIDFVPDIFLLFVSARFIEKEESIKNLADIYPNAITLGCTTAGEILGSEVMDDSISLTAIKFDSTKLKLTAIDLDNVNGNSYEAGKVITSELLEEGLRHIIVLSDGLNVNGAELVKGLNLELPKKVSITGGLAADCADFGETFIICNGEIKSKRIAALGLYGEALKIGFGSQGGWDSFGVERLVTRSDENILYELDGQPALQLYKSFLGDKASELPSSGLLFPLSMRNDDNKKPVVRTILSVNEEEQSLTFAGNIHQGSYVRLMKANIDRLINGAETSAEIAKDIIKSNSQLALLVSCVGRRLVLKQLVEEELEVVQDVIGDQAKMTGFYSYGEIAPFDKYTACQLHNQTMTITTFTE